MSTLNSELNILIIDDDDAIRDSMCWHLKALGYAVTTASEPTLCPVYFHKDCSAENRCADIIFIDENLPGMQGSEFIKQQAERGCKLPPQYKLIMTGAVTAELLRLAGSIGCKVVQKPFSLKGAELFVAKSQQRLQGSC